MQKESIAAQYIEEFQKIVSQAIASGKLEHDKEGPKAERIFEYSQISAGRGRIVYSSFSDEALCQVLIQKTKELGHVPAQKELYWIYRIYIKKRFGNWPKALIAAGLSKKAGKDGDSYEKVTMKRQQEEEMLEHLRQLANDLGRPPHMHEMSEAAELFRFKYDTWAQLLEAAGIDNNWKSQEPVYKVCDLLPEEWELLESIYDTANRLGRPPMRMEISPEVRSRLKKRCGTWRNILYQIHMEPIQKLCPFQSTFLDGRRSRQIKHSEMLEDSLFKLVNPDKETVRQLNLLRRQAVSLRRPPIKSEIPKEVWKNLMARCANYRNILYQIGMEPVDKVQEKEIEKANRRTRKFQQKHSAQYQGL
ncbi:hypothetical protein Ami103574_10100 [Aminipila butyrica]|uniref:Uncharacterized protein n=1 Tax=Aminipila butyrica TaxID=433296 RepID=A0A858BW63_9FIRM|nr:hypothetical protein [Aminipila butyrica]QIB69652.1 hypothetical protein Ami103574_10100 [Aminipila butyrica]